MGQVTISGYRPTMGPAPLHVRAVPDVIAGQFDSFTWRSRPIPGNGHWTVAGVTLTTVEDFVFVFPTPGVYQIGLLATGPDGPADTGRVRLVVVHEAATTAPGGANEKEGTER